MTWRTFESIDAICILSQRRLCKRMGAALAAQNIFHSRVEAQLLLNLFNGWVIVLVSCQATICIDIRDSVVTCHIEGISARPGASDRFVAVWALVSRRPAKVNPRLRRPIFQRLPDSGIALFLIDSVHVYGQNQNYRVQKCGTEAKPNTMSDEALALDPLPTLLTF